MSKRVYSSILPGYYERPTKYRKTASQPGGVAVSKGKFRKRPTMRRPMSIYPELKFLDCAWNAVTINETADGSGIEMQPSAGCTNALSVPAQGDGESNRDGRKYTIKSIWLSGTINVIGNADEADAAAQFGYFAALVLDTQANGATINSEDVYLNPSSQTSAMLPQPLRNLQSSKRFRVLASQYIPPQGTYGITDGTSTASLQAQAQPTVNLSWKGTLICDSIGTTADVASASDNAVHLVMCTGDNAIFTAAFSGKSRMRFYG